MDDELEGCLADARIAISAAHDHLTRIEERARRVRAEIETTVRAAVQWEMRAALAQARRDGAEAMRVAGLEACREALRDPADIAVVGRVADAIRAIPIDAKGGA